MSRVLVSSLAAVLCACPTPHTLPQDAGTADFVGRACNVDAECGSLRCDKVRHQCICLSDESCKSGDPAAPPRYCNNYTGLCVAEITGCTRDDQCGMTEWCDPSIRACRPLKTFCQPCTADSECGGAGDNCVLDEGLSRKFCGTACTQNGDCPRGATCQMKGDAKQCWPDKTPTGQLATCNNFQGCTPDSLKSCNTSADCGDLTQRCDVGTGRCVAVQQVCPFGTICDARLQICVAECLQDVDCGDPKLRCANRACEAINECQADANCAANKVCVKAPGAATGECKASCGNDGDCPLGTVCVPNGSRASCQPGCSTNSGCALDQRCNATSHQCEGPTVGAVRTCQATSACRACELCDGLTSECSSAKTGFPYCQPCSSPAECGGAGATCVALPDGQSYCARLCGSGQSECPQGFACLSLTTGGQACVPADRSCTGKCP